MIYFLIYLSILSSKFILSTLISDIITYNHINNQDNWIVINKYEKEFNFIKNIKNKDSFKYLVDIIGGQMDEFDERKTDLVLGQDRELLYISVDLKWFASYLFDKNFYASMFKNFIKYLYINLINNESDKYMTDINAFIAYIRRAQRTSTIKCFQGDYKQAEILSRSTGKPILLYIEDNNFDDPSISSVSLRLALSDVTLGNYINDNFIFCIGTVNHKPTKRLLQALGISKTFPILAIIGPIFKTNSKGKIIKLKGFDGSLETLAVYSYTIHEIKSYKMLKYLQRIRDSLGVKLLAEKKLFDSLVN